MLSGARIVYVGIQSTIRKLERSFFVLSGLKSYIIILHTLFSSVLYIVLLDIYSFLLDPLKMAYLRIGVDNTII